MFTVIEAADPESALEHPDIKNGSRVKLVLGMQVNEKDHLITFALSRPLPREHDEPYFLYDGNKVFDGPVVVSPKVALCGNPRIRSFLNGLSSEPKISVTSLALSEVQIRYDGVYFGSEKALKLFATACARVFDISDGGAILVLTFEP
ncbi:MAG: hypothetical protein V4611_04030 [Patescibacteria group bacterium]